MAFDLNPVGKRLYALRQRFSMVLFSRLLAEFDGNQPLCNTQQGYSPPGRGLINCGPGKLIDCPANSAAFG